MSTEAAGTGFVGGGITPSEASLAQFTAGERSIGGASRFGASGMGMSTGETMAGGVAPLAGRAIQTGQLSDQLSSALASFANAQQAASKGLTQQSIGTFGSLLGKSGSGTGSSTGTGTGSGT